MSTRKGFSTVILSSTFNFSFRYRFLSVSRWTDKTRKSFASLEHTHVGDSIPVFFQTILWILKEPLQSYRWPQDFISTTVIKLYLLVNTSISTNHILVKILDITTYQKSENKSNGTPSNILNLLEVPKVGYSLKSFYRTFVLTPSQLCATRK